MNEFGNNLSFFNQNQLKIQTVIILLNIVRKYLCIQAKNSYIVAIKERNTAHALKKRLRTL